MFERRDEQYLLRAINRNQVTLVLGAGFSTLAKNKLGNNLPTATEFAESLWNFLGYAPPYDPNSSLAELYEALLGSGKPVPVISDFLTTHLLVNEFPREYPQAPALPTRGGCKQRITITDEDTIEWRCKYEERCC